MKQNPRHQRFVSLALTIACGLLIVGLGGCGAGESADQAKAQPRTTAESEGAETRSQGASQDGVATEGDPQDDSTRAGAESAKSREGNSTSEETSAKSADRDMEEGSVSGTENGFASEAEAVEKLPTRDTGLARIPLPSGNDSVSEEPAEEIHTIEIPAGWKRLSQTEEIWMDVEKKEVIAGGYVCLNQGGLEMFICPAGTKEHESVLAVNARAYQVHASLLALGVEPGHPVQWDPDYRPAAGPKIRIEVLWKEGDQLVRRDGRELVRNFETKKELDVDWVFGGSFTETNPADGKSYYYGDGGELVCVSNFGTATMDLPIASSDADNNLMFEANTDKLPAVDTKVYVIFKAVSETPAGEQNRPETEEKSDESTKEPGKTDSDSDG